MASMANKDPESRIDSNGHAMLAAASHSNFPHSKEDHQHDIPQPQSQRQTHSSSTSSLTFSALGTGNVLTHKSQSNLPGVDRVATPHSMSSRQTRRSTNTRVENISSNRVVRSLPSWIDSYETSDDSDRGYSRATDRLLHPSPVHSASHHFGSTSPATQVATASTNKRQSQDGWIDEDEDAEASLVERIPERGVFGISQKTERGRKWDHVRSSAPVIIQFDNAPKSSWIPFIKSSMYGPAPNEEGKKVEPGDLKEMYPGYEKPWRGDLEDVENAFGLSHKRRRAWYQRLQHLLLTHPLVPLAFRITTLFTSIIALSLSCSIFRLSDKFELSQNPSTVMAIAVDVVAMPYIGYITWDEYTGKPLGLRSPKVKIRLVLLDLFFIIFESANASLAFDALTDTSGSCQSHVRDDNVCGRQAALGAILLIALMTWGMTFTVSIFRLVERVGGREEDNDD